MEADEPLRTSTEASRTDDGSNQSHPSTAALAESDRHRVLASERRRHVLAVLDGRSSSVTLSALAAAVAAREEGATPSDDETRERLAVSLHHVHLPLLDEHDVIEYDRGRNVIRA